MASIAIVLGSSVPAAPVEQVVRWIEDQARHLDGVQTVFLICDYNLPLFAEAMSPSMQASCFSRGCSSSCEHRGKRRRPVRDA